MQRNLANAQELVKNVKVAGQVKANVLGSEVDMGNFLNRVPKLPSLTYFLDNSAVATDTTFVIGDPTGMIAALIGGTVENPTTVAGTPDLVQPNKKFFFSVGIVYSSINYQTSTTPNQFSKGFVQYITNSAGELTKETINMASARRNTADDPLLLTITGQYMLDVHRGMVLSVLANESVTLTLTPSAYTV